MSTSIEISWFGSHFGEEPPVSGIRGSGTIFFGHCNLHCVFCQNWQISQGLIDCQKISSDKLVSIFLELQEKGCHNINLVTPTIWSVHLISAIKEAKKKGLAIPIVWNSNGYEKVETLKKLEGLIDIYLPDYKYADDDLGAKYSAVPAYSETAQKAILEMFRQVGDLVIDKNGIAQKGLIIRHLVLPSNLENTKKCLEFIRSISENIHLSLMTQYNPLYRAPDFPEINRSLNKKEFDKISKMMEELKFKNGWIQEFDGAVKCFNPDFSHDYPFGEEGVKLRHP